MRSSGASAIFKWAPRWMDNSKRRSLISENFTPWCHNACIFSSHKTCWRLLVLFRFLAVQRKIFARYCTTWGIETSVGRDLLQTRRQSRDCNNCLLKRRSKSVWNNINRIRASNSERELVKCFRGADIQNPGLYVCFPNEERLEQKTTQFFKANEVLFRNTPGSDMVNIFQRGTGAPTVIYIERSIRNEFSIDSTEANSLLQNPADHMAEAFRLFYSELVFIVPNNFIRHSQN